MAYTGYFHYGIADGLGNVIHNSKKYMKVVIESLDSFAEGKEVQMSSVTSDDKLNAAIRAKRYIGMPYDIIFNNCEHFAFLAHGHEPESRQLQEYFIMLIGVGLSKSKDPIFRNVGIGASIGTMLTPSEKSPFKNAGIGALIGIGLGIVEEILNANLNKG